MDRRKTTMQTFPSCRLLDIGSVGTWPLKLFAKINVLVTLTAMCHLKSGQNVDSRRSPKLLQTAVCSRNKVLRGALSVQSTVAVDLVFQARSRSMMPLLTQITRCSFVCLLVATLATPCCAADKSEQLSKALSYKPRQPDVVYEKVSDDEIDDCFMEEMVRSDGKGFWITGPGGQPLRWFADTNGDNKLDKWSYFDAGVEVYREFDSDFNGKADEYRWLGTQGLRRGIDRDEDKDAVIDEWLMISAEEVSAEAVMAAARRNAQQFRRLIISPEEIDQLGLGAAKSELLLQRAKDAAEQFGDWVAGQNVVTRTSRWTNFGADKPGIVPAGTDDSKKDVVVYENVVALLEDGGDAKQLLIGTLVRVGDCWRLVDLPRAVSEGSVVSDGGLFLPATFTTRNANRAPAGVVGGISPAMEKLMSDLQEIDSKLTEGGDQELLQARRADVIEKLVSAGENKQDRTTWIRQFADTVSAAAQGGEYPDGVKRLQEFTQKLEKIKADQDEIAYVVFRTITAEYNLEMQKPKAKYEELQKSYLGDLIGFVRNYPRSEDAAEAMIQIALSAEFSGEVKTAKSWYEKAGESFGGTLAGRKAIGALKRLNLEGQSFQLQAKTLDGRTFNSSGYRGGPVVYHSWASWCQGCEKEMRALRELRAKYATSKLRIVGMNFDNAPDTGNNFLEENKFPWVHLHEPGGLDSDLAVNLGILTLPATIIVDKDGKVFKSGVHWTELDGIIEGLVK